jgi:beta-galactosidase GanA
LRNFSLFNCQTPEIAPLREIMPDIPITTNFMGTYTGLDYWKFAPEVDVVSWDSYPQWHGETLNIKVKHTQSAQADIFLYRPVLNTITI